MADLAGEDYSDEYRRVLAGERLTPRAPQAGVQRRQAWAEDGLIDTRSNWQRERDAALRRFSSEPATIRGVANRLMGDDAAADAAYAQALKTQQEAAQLDSNVSTNWRDWRSPGDVLAGVRKTLTMSAPDMGLALLGAGVGRGLARRTVGNIERAAAVRGVEQQLANEGIDSVVGRRVAANAAANRVAAANPRVAEAQFQDAINATARQQMRTMPAVQARLDRVGDLGAMTGATIGAFPGIVNQDTEALPQTDRAGTLRMLPFQAGQAWLEPYTEMRLAGRALRNPYVAEALGKGLKTTRGALAQLPGRVARETARNVGSEALTEGAQGMLQSMGVRAAKGENPLSALASVDDWSAAIDQAIVGGLAGGAMGGTVETVNASVPAALDAGRWAWDQTGRIRQALRSKIGAAAARRRAPVGTEDAAPAPNGTPEASGGGLGDTLRAGLDTASQVFGRAKQGATSAARRFQQAVNDMTQHDDVDAATDDAMDWIQSNVVNAPRRALHPFAASAPTPLQAWALGKLNQDYLSTLQESDTRQLGSVIEKYANDADLSGAEHRLLRAVMQQPESGLSLPMLNASRILAHSGQRSGSKNFKDAGAHAPRMARGAGVIDEDAGGADVAGFDIAAQDEGDSAGVLTRDWDSGFSEQGFTDGVPPLDRLNSIRQSLRALSTRPSTQDAVKDAYEAWQRAEPERASSEHAEWEQQRPQFKNQTEALRAEGRALRRQLRDRMENGVVFTRNGSSDKAKAFWDRKTADKWVIPLEGGKTIQTRNGPQVQPQAVDLRVVIGRALAAINAEGSTEKPNIPLDMALARGLSELSILGYRIRPKNIPLGRINVGERGLVITKEMRSRFARRNDGRINGPFPRGEQSAPQEGPKKQYTLDTSEEELDAEYGRDDDESKYLDEPSSQSAFERQEYGQGAREAPPGARAAGGGFVPTMGVVGDVNIKSRYTKPLAEWLRSRKRAATPAQRRAVDIRYGQQIGASELAHQAEQGQINPTRLAHDSARLRQPEGKLALRYLERAYKGEIGTTVSVQHMKTDTAKKAKGSEADPKKTRVIDLPEKREFTTRTKKQAEVREKEEAKIDAPSSVPAGTQQTNAILRSGVESASKPQTAHGGAVIDVQRGTKRDALGKTYEGMTIAAAPMAPTPKAVQTRGVARKTPKIAPRVEEAIHKLERDKEAARKFVLPKGIRDAVNAAKNRVQPDAPVGENGEYYGPIDADKNNLRTADRADARSAAIEKSRQRARVVPAKESGTQRDTQAKTHRKVVLHKRPINVWAGTGENAQFSNLAARPFELRGHKYLTVEHAYQSLKSGKFDVDTYSKYTRAGQKVPGRLGVKTEGGWNIKLMDRLVYESFAQNPKAAKELLATGAAPFTHTQDKGVWNTAFPAALEKARQQLRAQAGVQNDDVQPGAESAAKSDGPHNLKAEQSMLNAVLQALGIGEHVLRLSNLKSADAKGNKGGSYKRDGRTVFINPNLHGAERVEVLMHELGHHIIWNEIAKHVEGGLDAVANMSLAEGLDALAKGNPELYAALRKDFDAWTAGGRRSQSPTYRYLRTQEEGLERSFKDDHDAFHEWMADNIARSLVSKRKVVGIVGKFFDAIATQLRKAWDIVSSNPRLRPARSVDAWVKQMLNANVAAVKEVTGQTQPQAQAETSVRAAATAAGAQAATHAGVGAPKFTKANIQDLAGFIENSVPLAARKILDRVFNRGVVLERIRDVFQQDPVLVRMMDHPAAGMTVRIALGYLAWQQGALNIGPQGQSVLMNVNDDLLKLAGVAGDGVLAQKVLNDIQTGTIQRFLDQNKKYDPREVVARKNRRQRVLNWVNKQIEDGVISRALTAFWTGVSDRMYGSGIPALHELAAQLQRPAGTMGQRDLGLATNIRVQTQRWNRRLREIAEPLSEKQQAKVMRALQRRLVAGDKAYEALSPAVRKAVEAVREMLRDGYAYQRQAGYTDLDIAFTPTYAPVLMDIRNDNARAKLTALYSKPEYARDVVIDAGFVRPDKKGKYDESEIKTLTDDPNKMAKAVEYLVRAAANDERVAPQGDKQDAKQDTTQYHFRHQNARLSAFIYKHGNPDDIKTFASLQTTSMGDLFARYFVPMIRWSETARTFGEVEVKTNKKGEPLRTKDGKVVAHMRPRAKLDKLLGRVRKQGGTDEDVALAENAVRAAIGIYGADGSPTIAALSPTLANKLKGRKVQGYIEGLQAYQNVRLLPLALLTNLGDPMGIAVRTGGTLGETWTGFKEGMSFIMNALGKDPEAAKRMLAELEDFDISEDFLPAIAATAAFNERSGKSRAVNDFVFKWNGVQTWVTATRVMALYAGHKFLLNHARIIDELGGKKGRTGAEEKKVQTSLRYLNELGIPRSAIKESATNPGKVEANDYTRAALRQFVDEAILRPNSQQAPLWMSDPYMGLVSQYKTFAYAIWDQIGGRIRHEVSKGNAGVMIGALMYLPIVMGAELLREGIQTAFEGDDRRKNWGPVEYAQLAAMKTGLPGPRVQIAGDIMTDIQRSRLPGTSQLGPTVVQGENVVDALEGQRSLRREAKSAMPASPLFRKWGSEDAGQTGHTVMQS